MRVPNGIAFAWVKKSENAEDSYERFVFMWFALNALYNEFMVGSERKAIGDLVFNDRYKLDNFQMEELLSNESVEFFKARVIRDCRGTGRDTAEQVAKLKSNSYSNRVKFKNLLFILYQVRCNLFHGNKMFGRDSDDEVVSHAASVLKGVMEVLLNRG